MTRNSGQFKPTWTAAEVETLRERFLAGDTDAQIAAVLRRTLPSVSAKRVDGLGLRRSEHPVEPPLPTWGPGSRRYSPYWTDERVRDALAGYAATHPGPLPRGTSTWTVITNGEQLLPTSARLLDQFGSMGEAWRAVLPAREFTRRIDQRWTPYTAAEDELIVDQLGRRSCAAIARQLGRTETAVKVHAFRKFGIRATSNQGDWTIIDIMREFGCSRRQVRALLKSGELPGRLAFGGTRWIIDPDDLVPFHDQLRRVRPRHRQPKVITRYADHRHRITSP